MNNLPIRVLHVLAGMNRGGAESFVMNVYRNIDRNKVQFDFLLFRNEECDYNKEIRELGGEIHYIPRYNGKNHFKFIKAWHRFFKQHQYYKILHGHVRSTASIYLSVAKKYGLNTICHSHSTSSRGNLLERIAKTIFQYPIRYKADHLFACSKEAGNWLFGTKHKFLIFNNAIDAQKFIFNENIRNKKRIELKVESNFVVGHIGTFTQPKNHTFLVDIFLDIYRQNNKAVLLLIGQGKLSDGISRKVSKLGIKDNVIFAGVRADIPELLQAMDIFIFPSIFEGVPVTVIEAQASGIYCLLSDNITKDVKITNSVEYVALNKPSSFWADIAIKKNIAYHRVNNSNAIKENGYDMKTEVKNIEEFYLDL